MKRRVVLPLALKRVAGTQQPIRTTLCCWNLLCTAFGVEHARAD